MNRNFREETTGTKQRQRPLQMGSLRNATMKEKEEELALFLEMRRKEKEERHDLLLQNSDEFDAPVGPRNGSSQIFNISSTAPRKTATDEFLNSDNDKNDYDWLITPPGTPLFPSLESESQRTVMTQLETSKARPLVLESKPSSPQTGPAAKSNLSARQPALSPGLTNSSSRLHRSSSSGGLRPASPTGRPNLSTTSKSTITSTSKPVITGNGSKPSLTVKPARSGTPNSRSTLPTSSKPSSVSRSSIPTASTLPISSKPSAVPRSSTPMARSTSRSSTPTARASVPPSKATSRSSTPTRRPTNPAVAPVKSPSSSSVIKSVSTNTKNPAPPRSSSPSVKPRTVKPSDIPGFSLAAPPNLRTSLPNRPISATRGRPGVPSVRTTSSLEPPPSNGRVRRQSCSPSRGRPPNANLHSNGSSVPALNRLHAKANDNISPVMIGTKMVDRVMNMRKLGPPKQDNKHSPNSNLSGKSSSSPDSSGFGRSLSKKSLDMAIRHMDILRTVPGNLRPLMSNVPASSMYSVRSGATRSRTVSVTDSPVATSSNASSSEISVNNSALCVDGEIYEDFSSDNKDIRSPASLRGR